MNDEQLDAIKARASELAEIGRRIYGVSSFHATDALARFDVPALIAEVRSLKALEAEVVKLRAALEDERGIRVRCEAKLARVADEIDAEVDRPRDENDEGAWARVRRIADYARGPEDVGELRRTT